MPGNGSILQHFGAIRLEASSLEASRPRGFEPDGAKLLQNGSILLHFVAGWRQMLQNVFIRGIFAQSGLRARGLEASRPRGFEPDGGKLSKNEAFLRHPA